MNITDKFILALGCLVAVCCAKPEIPSHYFDNGEDEEENVTLNGDYTKYEEINGTAISSENNAVGLVYDAETNEGIPGVPVTDGYTYTVTDDNGVYQMKANRYCRMVYISIPAEYEVPMSENNAPLFYSKTDFNRKEMNRNDFALKKLPAVEEDWTLIAIGDPQCSSIAHRDRYVNETLSDLRSDLTAHLKKGEYQNPYALTLGDIVSDTPELFPDMAQTMSNFSVEGRYLPFFQCIGNHDHNAEYSSAYESVTTYMEHFGPVDYSFNRGKVHVVVMDNVIVKENRGTTWKYDGGYTDLQWKWLQEDLKQVEDKEDKMIILAGHIPFRGGVAKDGASVSYDRYYKETLEALTQFKEAHILIGHTHYTQNYIHGGYKCAGGNPVYEHVLCAACGAWWSSNLSAAGSPNGYTYFEIRGNSMYNWVARGTGMTDNDAQMRVYSGNATYGKIVGEGETAKDYTFTWTGGGYMNLNSADTKKSTTLIGQEILRDCLIAAIWGDDDSEHWKVSITYKGETYPMKRVTTNLSDMCVSAFYRTELNKNNLTWAKALKTYWYAKIPGLDPDKSKGWTITATQTFPSSDKVNVYTCTDKLQTDYTGFAH